MPATPGIRHGAVTTTKPLAADPGKGPILGLALAFFAICTWTSYTRWANFEYRTFDLAYYVQALWQLIHGRFEVSVEGVPLLGNHVEPIVFLIAPVFLLFRHPLLFVLVQNAALASMGPVAFSIGQRLGLDRRSALLLAGALLITPATGYIALHEFHPEALTAPFLLLMLRARLRGSLRAHWAWLIALLACKENMALLVAAYCAVHLLLERKRPGAELRGWYLWPLALSVSWFLACTCLITPALNAGNIDYAALYDRLGASAGDILIKAITQPQRIFTALCKSLAQGNLLWALLFPFLALPLVRPRWLFIAAPILLQHLLSWRSSEWTIYFHYAAPLLPLFWIALAESAARIDRRPAVPIFLRRTLSFLVIAACITAQSLLGPARNIATATASWSGGKQNRERKAAFVSQIPPDASVVAPLPYLSHLATREKLYSLHYVLKGLKTLSRATYEPPQPTDFVLLDYEDSATFDAEAGYYHPAMKTVDGRVIPSSDRLLHEFLRRASWAASSSNELTLLQQEKTSPPSPPTYPASSPIQVGAGSELINITKSRDQLTNEGIEIKTNWTFQDSREVIPWMFLKLTPRSHEIAIVVTKGLCAPEAVDGSYQESWHITPSERIPQGDYAVEAFFVDNSSRVWAAKSGQRDAPAPLLAPPVPLGELKVTGPARK
ncbi:MAG TPA: DUF2079 domain-containing protein [Chthoniobacterales bacterium]|nr:DUF2079 domain-containing protein [Chthoniobacterales bacterium]